MIIGSAETNYVGGVITSHAYSGRTDSQGGHHDNNNKSGLGSYNYHHGYSAHLHPNGVCPYALSSSKQISNSVSVKKAESSIRIEDYKLTFDSDFYYNNNSDLQAVLGSDQQKLLEYFVKYGMAEGRKGCGSFDVKIL